MNLVQKAVSWMLYKATGFPPWNTSTWPAALRYFGSAGSAESLAVVYGCCKVRGETLGSVPFHVYRENPSTGRRDKALDHPLYAILHDSPNAYQTSMDFRTSLERSFCLWGNAYAEINRIRTRIVSLNFLRPDNMRVRIDTQKGLIYEYTTWDGKTETYSPERILHIKNFSDDGICGVSPLLRYVMEHALVAQSFSSNFLKNAGRLAGYISHEGKRPASDGEVEKYKADWQAEYGGAENAGKTPVLWNKSAYVPISVPPEEAQLLETAKRLTGDIAGSIYGVPLNLLGQESQTSTYASAEQFALAFVKHCIRPQAVRYEQAFNKALLGNEPNVYCELDLDGLQRGDSQAQAAYFSTLVQNGLMTRHEARRKLNLPDIDGSDSLTVQSNLIDLDKLGQVVTPQLPQTSSAGGNL